MHPTSARLRNARETGGGDGDVMIALCAACQEPFERLDLIGGLCSTCLANGAPIQLGPLDTLTKRNLTRGYGKRDVTPGDATKHRETPPKAVKREEPMPTPTKTCRQCGKEMPKGSLYRHEKVTCPMVAGVGQLATQPVTVAVHAQRPLKRATARALVVLADKSEIKTADTINHPAHYNKGRIEVIDFIEDQQLGFHLGNVIKYVCRQTSPADLRKAAWYLDREIARQEQAEPQRPEPQRPAA